MKQDFPPGFEADKNIIAIDFDGVIHNDDKGFHDGTIYGKSIPGCYKGIETLYKKGYKLVIFTAKAKTDRPLVNGKTGVDLVWEWLEKLNLSQFISEVTAEKPRAAIYIDDKGYCFKSWENTIFDLIDGPNKLLC